MDKSPWRILDNENLIADDDPTGSSFEFGPLPTFRELVEDLPVMVYAVQAAPPYSPIYVSPAFESFGYPLDEWINNPAIWLKVIHPEDQDRVFAETVESAQIGTDAEYEYR